VVPVIVGRWDDDVRFGLGQRDALLFRVVFERGCGEVRGRFDCPETS